MNDAHYKKMVEARKFTKRIAYKPIIKEKCLECSAYVIKEVRKCPVTSCPLHPIRPFQPQK